MSSHPNVLRFIGLGRSEAASVAGYVVVVLVSPWLRNGNMLSYVKRHKDAKRVSLVRCTATLPLYRIAKDYRRWRLTYFSAVAGGKWTVLPS